MDEGIRPTKLLGESFLNLDDDLLADHDVISI